MNNVGCNDCLHKNTCKYVETYTEILNAHASGMTLLEGFSYEVNVVCLHKKTGSSSILMMAPVGCRYA